MPYLERSQNAGVLDEGEISITNFSATKKDREVRRAAIDIVKRGEHDRTISQQFYGKKEIHTERARFALVLCRKITSSKRDISVSKTDEDLKVGAPDVSGKGEHDKSNF